MPTPSKDENITNPNLSDKQSVALRQKNVQNILLSSFSELQTKPHGLHTVPSQDPPRYRDIISYLGSPETLVSIMSNPTNVSPFINATSPQLAQLVPKLEFFYEAEGTDEQFKFSDFTDWREGGMGQTLAASRTKKDSAVILNKRGTLGTDVGVKSFNWTFDNKHEGDKTIKADLTLYFGSITELLNQEYLKFIFVNNENQIGPKKRDQTDDGQRLDVKREIANRYRLMDKGLTSGRRGTQHTTGTGNNKTTTVKTWSDDKLEAKTYSQINSYTGFRQLKIKVGWEMPEGPDFSFGDSKFKQAILGTQKLIGLHMVKYNLAFEQEGQVTLKIEYVGSLDSVLASEKMSNVLEDGPTQNPVQKKLIPIQTHMSIETGIAWDSYTYFKDEAWNGTFEGTKTKGFIRRRSENEKYIYSDANSDQEVFRIRYSEVDFELETLKMHLDYLKKFDDGAVKQMEKVQKGINACEIALQLINSKISAEKYSKFMKILFGSGKVNYLTVEKFAVRKGDKGNARRRKALKKMQEKRKSEGRTPQAKIKIRGSVGDQRTRDKISERASRAIYNEIARRRSNNKEYKTSDLAALDPLSTDGISSDLTERPGKITVYYVRLGDIISAAMHGLPAIGKFERKVMLGTFQPFPLSIQGCTETDMWSISDIPIAVDFFGQWFLDNFVQKDPPPASISFRRFVDLLLNTLVAPLFNETFARNKTNKIKFEISTSQCSIDISKGEVVTADVLKQKAKKQGNDQALNPGALYNYFLVTMAQTNSALKGDKEKDEDLGIYHLIIGHDRGIVKSFSFTEKQMPSLRAMHIVNNNKGSALVLPQDVELKMVGNTLFKNGQRVHINADFALGSATARKLGIGGYYTVVKSSNSIAPGEFNTTVTCMFEKSTKGPS